MISKSILICQTSRTKRTVLRARAKSQKKIDYRFATAEILSKTKQSYTNWTFPGFNSFCLSRKYHPRLNHCWGMWILAKSLGFPHLILIHCRNLTLTSCRPELLTNMKIVGVQQSGVKTIFSFQSNFKICQ